MRFPHRARSRRPNPEPASLIAPVVSESARLLRIDPKCFPRSMAFCLGGRSAPFFAPDRFSAAHARKPSQPFKSRRALSRLSFARSEKTPRVRVASCAPRARVSTHADERDARTSAPRRFSRDTPRLRFSPTCPPTNRSRPSLPVVAETPRGPRGGSRRRRARPRTPRARSWWPPRRSPPARSRSARRAGCTTPTAPRWGRCTGTRGARVASRTVRARANRRRLRDERFL